MPISKASQGDNLMEAVNLEKKTIKTYRRCAKFRECHQEDCIFFKGEDDCWALVSPFKLRRRPSLLLKDTAERCQCLWIPCTECEYINKN